MIRRARLSFKPNVRPGGRSVGSGARDGGSSSQPEEPVQPDELTVTTGPVEDDKSRAEGTLCVSNGGEPGPDILEKSSAASNENEHKKPASAPLQRRKRISTLPNLAKPRVSSSAPVTPSQKPQQVESPPSLPVSSVPSIDEASQPEKAKVPSSLKSQVSNSSPQGQHATLPEKRTPIPQVPQFSPLKKAVKSVEEFSPLKERPSQKSTTNECKTSIPKKLVAAGNLEKERLRRAQKLRQLLKDELRKERKEWKSKHPVSSIPEQDRSKMVMRDFIYFIPENNPMSSSFLAEPKGSEKSPTESQLSGTPVKNIDNLEEEEEEEDNDMDEEEDKSQLLAPRVKVAEDGSIILDEESLTVEVSRGNAPIVEGNDPIFERGSTTTYSSFRKSNYSKPWSQGETDMFFLAISMVGTDFSMISQLFPHRQRIEIKNKFKREERANSWRIDKAFREKKVLNFEFFGDRLEKVLEEARRKRMPKSYPPREKKARKPRKKQKEVSEDLSDGEMVALSDGEGADKRTEEKENEGSESAKEGLLPSDHVPAKKRRSRKKKRDTKESEEEETCGSLSEDTTKLPKKPRKAKAAEHVQDSDLTVNDKNHEDDDAAPDTGQDKKKKLRKKKSVEKEAEKENTADGDNISMPSPPKERRSGKSTSPALPDNSASCLYGGSGELSFTQSEVLAGAIDSSMLLFTEGSDFFSEPENISSLKESLSEIPGSQTLAEDSDVFLPGETSQEDSVFENDQHLVSDSPTQIPLEKDMVVDSHTGTKVEGSTDSQKDSLVRPAALTRSRLQRPKPNVPVRTVARQEKVLVPDREDTAELTTDNCLSQSHSEGNYVGSEELELSVPETQRTDEISGPAKKNSSSESSPIHLEDSVVDPPQCATAKEDISVKKPLPVRGRLVRPKPNLKKSPVKEKPAASETSSSPVCASQDSEETSMAPCNDALTPLCSTNKEDLIQEKIMSSATTQQQCIEATIKPAPIVLRTSTKEKDEAQPIDFVKQVPASEESSEHQEKGLKSSEVDQVLPRDPNAQVSVNLGEEIQKPAVLSRGRLQRPKPNLGRALPKKDVPSTSNECKDETCEKSLESSLPAASLSQYDVGENGTEDTPEILTQSRVLPLETIMVSDMDQMVGEVSASMSVDNSSHVKIKNDGSTSEDERMVKPTESLTRNRMQKPKPNLGSSARCPAVSSLQKCDVLEETTKDTGDTLSLEKSGNDSDKQSVNVANETSPAEDSSSCNGEQVEAPSAKPLRNRLQKPKPNLGRASVRKEARTFTSQQDDVNVDSSSKITGHIESKELPDLHIKDTSGGHREESAQATIKPAQLRRGRLVRPVPNLGKSTNKRAVSPQSKKSDEEVSPADKHLEVLSSKRKASENVPDVSSKRSCHPDLSQHSSDSSVDQAPSTSTFEDSSQSNDILQDNKHSRYGRLLKKPIDPPVLVKPSENVSERPEKEKTSRTVRSLKSKAAKPISSKGKTTLVKIRAMTQDDEDDDESGFDFEDEDYDLAPDKMNQAPVFVPFSLRSPKPVPAEIEVTLEEFEIPTEELIPIDTAQSLPLQDVSPHVEVSHADPGNKAHCDGSAEAAMTLISMGNSAFQPKSAEPLDTDQCTESQLLAKTDCEPESSAFSVQMACTAEDDTALSTGTVDIGHDAPGDQERNKTSAAKDEQNEPGISDPHTSGQSSLAQMSYPDIQEDVQQQDSSMTGCSLENGASGGETTFILTLVAIPVSEEFPFSCDENSANVLPAPLLLTPGSPQVLTPDQSSQTAVLSEPASSQACLSEQEEAIPVQSPSSRKRSASVSVEDGDPQPSKKALLCSSVEDHGANMSAFEENEESSSSLANVKSMETEECLKSSADIPSVCTGGEKSPECPAEQSKTSKVTHAKKSANTSLVCPRRLLLSSSGTRPEKKHLGFLPLVCKEKSNKTKAASKKNVLKPMCKKGKAQDLKKEDGTPIHEDAPSSEVPSHSSSPLASTPIEHIPSTQVSENPDSKNISEPQDTIGSSEDLGTKSQESPKSQELATEEEASTVSEFFISDIFMEVDY